MNIDRGEHRRVQGNFIAYPTGTPTSTSVLNYQSGQAALANGAIVPVCQPSCPNQLTIATNGAGADVVIDIVGYFKPPGRTGYVDNGDGTVTDNKTGLMWEQKLASNSHHLHIRPPRERALCAEHLHLERRVTLYGPDRDAVQRLPATAGWPGFLGWRALLCGVLRLAYSDHRRAAVHSSRAVPQLSFQPMYRPHIRADAGVLATGRPVRVASNLGSAWDIFFSDGDVVYTASKSYNNYARAVRGGR